MKKIILLMCISLLALTACQSNGSNETSPPEIEVDRGDCDFRNAKWGDSIEDVKRYEELEIVEEGETILGTGLMVNTNVAGYNANALFVFEDDKLYTGAYDFKLQYINAGQYIPVYKNLKKGLSEKYGQPFNDVIQPLTDESLIEYAGEARSLEYGYVHYMTTWKTDTTNIGMSMVANGIKINLMILYVDNTHETTNTNGL